jgi:hypothetical protein
VGGATVCLRAPQGACVDEIVEQFLAELEEEWGYRPELRGCVARLCDGVLEITVWVHT